MSDKTPDFVGFARKLFELTDWPQGGEIDMFDFQDTAEAFGLLRTEKRFEPCGETCFCLDYAGREEFSHGVTCYLKCDELMSKPSDSTVSEAPDQMNELSGVKSTKGET